MIVDNVTDGRRGVIGSWTAEPLDYDKLRVEDVSRTVIYLGYGGRAEAGTLSSWRNSIVFARYSRGDTAAGAHPADLVFGIKALDSADEIMAAHKAERA